MEFLKMSVGNLKDDRNINGLIRLLEDEDHSIREQAILALAEIGDASCVLPIAQSLQDKYLSNRIAACSALIQMGSQVVEPIIELLKDQNWIVREGAVQVLEKIGDTRAIYPLIEALKDTNTQKISNALRSIGPESFEPLIEALQNKDSRIRGGAAMVLGEMKNPVAIDALTKVTKDKDPVVQQFANSAIHRINYETRKKGHYNQ
jgi:HEAT repeat protein